MGLKTIILWKILGLGENGGDQNTLLSWIFKISSFSELVRIWGTINHRGCHWLLLMSLFIVVNSDTLCGREIKFVNKLSPLLCD